MSRDKRIKCDKCTEKGKTSVIEVVWTSDATPRHFKCSRGHRWIEHAWTTTGGENGVTSKIWL